MTDNICTSIDASYFLDTEVLEGKIIFDNESLYFNFYDENKQRTKVKIVYSNILSIIKRDTLGPNGFLIVTKNGLEYKFVTIDRYKFMEFLMSKI